MFLKIEDVQSGAINFRYHGHVGPAPKSKKAGGTWEAYTFDLEISSTGQRFQYDISKTSAEYGEERITGAKTGDTIQAFKNGDWVNWKLIPSVSEPDGMPHNNSKEVKTERTFGDLAMAKDIQICIQGFMQAHIHAGAPAMEALELAVLDREMLLDKVASIISPE